MVGVEPLKFEIPEVIVIPRKDFIHGWRFYCPYCLKWHLHGEGLGHRTAHCINNNSPFDLKGYSLVAVVICSRCNIPVIRRSNLDRKCPRCGEEIVHEE